MYLPKYNWSSITRNAWRNRQELISAGLTSRLNLMNLGLLTRTGYLLANGVNGLFPLPTIAPNNALGEGRTRPHQAFINYPGKFPFPPQKVHEIRQREALVYGS